MLQQKYVEQLKLYSIVANEYSMTTKTHTLYLNMAEKIKSNFTKNCGNN